LNAVNAATTLRKEPHVELEFDDGEMTIVFRYELLDDGRRLRAMERLRGGGRDQDNIWIFDRR